MHILDVVDAANLKSDIPDFRAGDNVKVCLLYTSDAADE